MFADELKEEEIGIGSMELIEVLLGEDNPGLVVNVDVEGADIEVLQSLDFNIYRPKLICIEIMKNSVSIEKSEIYKFLIKLNYIKTWSGIFSHIFIDNL